MRIWLDPDRMAALGVTPLDVRAALANNNFTSAPGQVKGDFVQTNIDAKTSLDNPEAFGRLVVVNRSDALGPPERRRRDRAWATKLRFLPRSTG
jgi:multidrug efflux pump subunit AcrB